MYVRLYAYYTSIILIILLSLYFYSHIPRYGFQLRAGLHDTVPGAQQSQATGALTRG